MRRLIICTGIAENEAGEKIETCSLVWTYVRKESVVKALPENADLPEEQKAQYRNTYKVYHYIRPVKGSIGITLQEPPKSYATRFDTDEGALVTEVEEGSPASQAEINKGDIIVSINDLPFVYGEEFSAYHGGENEVTVYRNGEVMTKTVYLP